jgi:RNA polymerase sigma-70 factor (ECF subfamily)
MELEPRAAINGLIIRLRDGDRSAGSELFHLLWPVLRNLCSRLLMDSSSAEDAAQRAITRVFEQASRFDPARDGLAWALEIAVWECRTERRRLSRSREVLLPAPPPEIPEERASAAERLEQAELGAALEAALGHVPALDRETLRLMLRDSTAAVPAATWRKRKERALRRLKLTWRTLYGFD